MGILTVFGNAVGPLDCGTQSKFTKLLTRGALRCLGGGRGEPDDWGGARPPSSGRARGGLELLAHMFVVVGNVARELVNERKDVV